MRIRPNGVMSDSSQMLERIRGVAGELRLDTLQPQIAACGHLLGVRRGIDVAVFGRFKAGKSSFLNHLAGRAVLPIGVVPLTAVVTRLRFGERDRAEVRFLDGTTKEVPLADIERYVGERENPGNTMQVASVEVELPELMPMAPLRFVDTPGLGSAFTHNTEVALNWLPSVGAALVAVSSDAPLSERDLALLEELRRHTPKIVLLLTKADLLTNAQQAEVKSFIIGQLRQKWDGGLPLYCYSVKPEFAPMKATLMAELLDPLRLNRGDAGTAILQHKLLSLRNQALNFLRVALAAATQAESARAALRGKLTDERDQLDLFRAELSAFTREQMTGALDQYLAALDPVRRTLQERITAELRVQFPRWHLRLPPLLAAWRNWLDDFLRRELAGVSQAQQPMFRAPVRRSQAHLTRTLQAFHDRLSGHVQTALGVTLDPREFALAVREPEAPPVSVAYAFDAAFTTVAWMIPVTLFRSPIERVLLRKARYEVEKNLSRLASAWRDRITIAIEDLHRQSESAALEELTALERMLEQTPSGVPKLREQIAGLEALPLP